MSAQTSPIPAPIQLDRHESNSHNITSCLPLPQGSHEHPLRRLGEKGLDALTDGELLALILSPRLGDEALAVALSLLSAHGGLRGLQKVAERPLPVCQIKDEGLRGALIAAFALSERSAMEPMARGEAYTSSEISRRYLEHRLGAKETEVFAALFLDTRHRLIEYRELFFGTVDATNVYFREVLRIAMSLNSAAIVLCHNHPSGNANPSHADIEITKSLKRILELVDVRVLDHIVVTANASSSMMELGLL